MIRNNKHFVEKAEHKNITILPSIRKKGLRLSKKILGKEDLSGIIRYLINKEEL